MLSLVLASATAPSLGHEAPAKRDRVMPAPLPGAAARPVAELPQWSGATVDLDARLLVETRALGADGVTRTTRYEEQLVRRGPQVWTRRVLPAHTHDHKGPEKGKHKHLNPVEAGRLVSREAGGVSLSLVLPEARTVVAVPAPEYGNVGFDGSWDRAYHLITPAELARMRRSGKASAVPGASWYERETAEQRERLLWDPALQIVRRIESVSLDGRRSFSLQVTPQASSLSPAPWQSSASFEQKRYADYLD